MHKMPGYALAPQTSIPARAGIGLRAEHYHDMLNVKPDIGWVEIHSENYFGLGGKPHFYLEKIREDYPLSLHGVGLSLGSTDPLDMLHLHRIKQLIQRYQPDLISEHLSWGSLNAQHFNDLLPLPFVNEALNHMIERVNQVQAFLGRRLLIENISSYIQFSISEIPEWEFLTELSTRTDCGILLDINNIYVNSRNHGFNPEQYISSIPTERVKEMHLAGHTRKIFPDGEILIDSHDQRVCQPVWDLYQYALERFPRTPTLIEWDSNLPPLATLIDEAKKADNLMQQQNSGGWHEHVKTVAN